MPQGIVFLVGERRDKCPRAGGVDTWGKGEAGTLCHCKMLRVLKISTREFPLYLHDRVLV